jgi:hypothetical protein
MAPALIALAARIGAPVIRDVLARKLGRENAELAGEVIGMIARRAGVAPEAVEQLAADEPDRVAAAIQSVEADVAELAPLYAAELGARQDTYRIEQGEPLWVRAWRPLGMYGLGFLWFWNLILLHVANAYWKIALPATDLGVLMQISALYMSLYMGGHTVKDVMAKWSAR